MTRLPACRRDAGFALLIVLWSLVLLSLILTQVLSAGRSEAQLAGNLRNAAVAEAIADGAVREAVFHLLGGAPGWMHGTHAVRIGRGVAEVTVDDVAGTVNPNTAGAPLLRALIGLCGANASDAARLAQAIVAWRGAADAAGGDVTGADAAAPYRAAGLGYAPPGLPMQTPDELALVVGMTPALFGCLTPHVSLYQDGDPSPRTDDPLVARALVLAAQDGAPPAGTTAAPSVFRITARATVTGGRFARRATVRLTPGDSSGPFRILGWETPGS